MKPSSTLHEINDCIQEGSINGLEPLLDTFLKETNEEDACKQLAGLLGTHYTQFKSEFLALVLEKIIRKRPTLALVEHPFNFIFQTIISTGSMEMYECYLEEAILPFLANVVEEEHEVFYLELLGTAQELSNKLFLQNKKCIKGRHFNGAFSTLDENEAVDLIHHQDYVVMSDVVERYNAIIGRQEIIDDLERRVNALT